MAETFEPTLSAARDRIAAVQPAAYARTRNALDGAVSGLSPYITHGFVTLAQVLVGVAARHALDVQHKFVQELGWRAYFRHVWQHRGDGILHSLHDGPLPEGAYAVALPAEREVLHVLPQEYVVDGQGGISLARQLPGQMAFFAMGIVLWKIEPQLRRRWRALAVSGTILLAATLMHPALEPLRALALAGLIAGAAFAPGPPLSPARFGDISYGLYITHFPILQAMAAAGLVATLGLAGFLALAALFVILASLALWHFVEKPALRPSSHYRKVAA